MRWHTWVQDLYDARLHLPVAEGEIRWNWVKRWGDPYLQPATEHGRYLRAVKDYDYEVSFCGYHAVAGLSLAPAPENVRRDGERILAQVYALWEEDVFDYRY